MSSCPTLRPWRRLVRRRLAGSRSSCAPATPQRDGSPECARAHQATAVVAEGTATAAVPPRAPGCRCYGARVAAAALQCAEAALRRVQPPPALRRALSGQRRAPTATAPPSQTSRQTLPAPERRMQRRRRRARAPPDTLRRRGVASSRPARSATPDCAAAAGQQAHGRMPWSAGGSSVSRGARAALQNGKSMPHRQAAL